MVYPDLTTELDAINAMLSSIGEAPISGDLDSATQADVVVARNILTRTNREVQSMGWRYNLDFGLEIPPSGNFVFTDRTGVSTTLNVFEPPANLAKFEVSKCDGQLGTDFPDAVLRPAGHIPGYTSSLADSFLSSAVRDSLLLSWFRAKSLLGQVDFDADVSTWTDEGSMGKNATSTASDTPSHFALPRFVQEADGSPSLDFSNRGTTPAGLATDNIVIPTSGTTLFFVGKRTGVAVEFGTFFQISDRAVNNIGGTVRLLESSNEPGVLQWSAAGPNTSGGSPATDWFIYSVVFESNLSTSWYCNGALIATLAPHADTNNIGGVLFGSGGQIRAKEFLWFDRAFGDANRSFVEQYLAAEHGITLSTFTGQHPFGTVSSGDMIFYDRANNLDGFERDYLYIDAYSLFPFDRIPETVRNYIVIRSARKLAQQALGSAELSTFSAQDELQALRNLKRDQGEEDDYNILDNSDVSDILGLRPYGPGSVYDPRNNPGQG